ncbi:MAG: hypothetical protein M1540_05405 [Candidatus Bathyarchaeota archaeon]|nr:hypothetical protein [Candidatus Bathyarchaeota archaeon]
MPKKKKDDARHLPVVECFCGEKILLIPNVKKMSLAIETHTQKHIKKLRLPKKEAELEAERVRDDLTAKVLQKACEI